MRSVNVEQNKQKFRAHAFRHSAATMYAILEVSQSVYYNWKNRSPLARKLTILEQADDVPPPHLPLTYETYFSACIENNLAYFPPILNSSS